MKWWKGKDRWKSAPSRIPPGTRPVEYASWECPGGASPPDHRIQCIRRVQPRRVFGREIDKNVINIMRTSKHRGQPNLLVNDKSQHWHIDYQQEPSIGDGNRQNVDRQWYYLGDDPLWKKKWLSVIRFTLKALPWSICLSIALDWDSRSRDRSTWWSKSKNNKQTLKQGHQQQTMKIQTI